MWSDTTIIAADITTVTGTDLLTAWRAATGGYQPVGATVRRTILRVSATADGTIGEGTSVRLGLIAEAAAAVAEVPDPVAEPFADWAFNQRIYLNDTAMRFESQCAIDVRAGRVLRELGTTWWLMISPELAGATDVTFAAHVRTLLSLP